MAASVISAAGAWAEGPARSSETLTIVDLDGTKIPLSVADLRKMPVDIEEELICVGHSSGFIGIFDYSGVRLSELFKKAKAAEAASEYRRENMYVLFRGTDGYQTLASWTELTMTTEGKRVMIAIDKNAEPLPPLEGKFRLILPGDKWVGRSVKCLETIEIRCPDGVVDKKKDDKKEEKKP
ncbi:MAG TPA: molybdopterin-dependent oxidoreductase [Candidatus Hydrogenedentes bacterium]|nr:molybdopterin-dependent oxidoreductase [Candidatus Hydrogenedentota bacterium]HPC18534.1 molybdopterin-dependent oxidoreductase [Candidatus Hydrogenedentota bacterium]HRT22258.1 molybdopterin-dependent oxidoreductase [Candidatus Hydrogenedentota bacterium]HRT67015.1 molybdopterin-dependent oxidoreductase [Candidatus Hydrogenedentota bacterium]